MLLNPGLAFLLLIIVTVLLTAWKGGAPERLGAAVLVAMVVMSKISTAIDQRAYVQVDSTALVQDIFAVVCFGVLAIYSRRVWPIWATSLQLLSFFSHLARAVQLDLPPLAYALMKTLPTFFATVVVMTGTLAHWKRMRENQFVSDWKHW